MRIIVLLLLFLLPSVASAQYAPVIGTPEIDIQGRTLRIWASMSPVGDFVGVFEQDNFDKKWYALCSSPPEYPNAGAAINAAGGAPSYIDSKAPGLNACLADKFSGVITGGTAVDALNIALQQFFTVRQSNGVPSLARR